MACVVIVTTLNNMKKYTKKIEIQIDRIAVGKRFFSFWYEIKENGKVLENGEYSSDHTRSPTSMRKWLRNHYAVEIIMQKIYG